MAASVCLGWSTWWQFMHLGCMTTLAIGSNSLGSPGGAAWIRLQAATGRTTTSGKRIRIVFSSSGAELALQGQLPDALAGRREDGVGQRGRGDRRRRFPQPARRFQGPYHLHFDLRRFVDPEHASVVTVRL